MKTIIRIILVLLLVPVILFSFNIKPALAIDNSALIAQLQAQIASLIKQIIVLLQQQVKTQSNNQINSQGTATLTVNAAGVMAYVSINGGAQFAYTSPITLNSGDTYSVTASSSNNGTSTSKCSGTASSGGSYVCNINMNSY